MGFSIKRWGEQFRERLFYYSDGFYELPYVANSPELTVESFKAMPFVKSNTQKETFVTSNPFMHSSGHYHMIEEGLWVIMSELHIKKDLCFKLYYQPDLPAPYHFLTLYLNRGTLKVRNPKINRDIDNMDRSWTLFKAGSKAMNTHFKGQKSIFFTIYFNDEWMSKNIMSDGVLKNESLQRFFDSEDECLYLPNFLDDQKEVYENIVNAILSKGGKGVNNELKLKINTLELMASFIDKLDDSTVNTTTNSMSVRDRRAVLRAEHILNGAIFSSFPTISAISKEVGVSETKIKSDFKQIYGMTMNQYFTHIQMKYSKELLLTESLPVKEVAYSMGYSSPSKFTAAFKRVHGHLPSELK